MPSHNRQTSSHTCVHISWAESSPPQHDGCGYDSTWWLSQHYVCRYFRQQRVRLVSVQENVVSHPNQCMVRKSNSSLIFVWFNLYISWYSGNQITECLDFAPPKCDERNHWAGGQNAIGSMLTLANMCQNRIAFIRDLSDHPFLECLLLKRNLIPCITGLQSLKYLRVLDISYNRLTVIEGLDHLNIEELNVDGNNIQVLNGLSLLPRLSTFNAAHNLITDLSPLADCKSLLQLNLQHNRIEIIRQVEHLSSIPWLRDLDLAGNPCFSKPYFRERVVFRLPNLTNLDASMISSEERVGPPIFIYLKID